MWPTPTPGGSLRLLRAEATLSYLTFFMPIITVYYLTVLGMDYFLIACAQAIFLATLLVAQIPLGWLADHWSPKWCNVIGDCVAAGGFIVYGLAHSFTHVALAEIIWALGVALSEGADTTLIERYTVRVVREHPERFARYNGNYFDVIMSSIETFRRFAQAGAFLVGGFVGAYYGLRYAVGMSAVTLLIAAFVASRVPDIPVVRSISVPYDRLGQRVAHAVTDVKVVLRYIRTNPSLRWRMWGLALTHQAATATAWIFTPLLLIAGVPLWIVSAAWVIKMLAEAIGAYLAGGVRFGTFRTKNRMATPKPAMRYGVAAVCFSVAIVGLSVNISVGTVGLYLLIGFTRGWSNAITAPLIQKIVPDGDKATIVSVYGSLSSIIGIIIMLVLGGLAGENPQSYVRWMLVIVALIIGSWFGIRRHTATTHIK